jgi:mono/diheme cytochrome c family protein
MAAGVVALGVATVAVAQVTPPAAPAPADAAAAGVFTAEQAERGLAAYTSRCSACHGDDITHVVMGYPDAGQFFSFISTEMPASAPGSLQPQMYADIIAYLLSVNGFAAGPQELLPDPAVLEQVVIKAPATP